MPDINSYLTPEGTPERCGILTKRGKVIELKNTHANPAKGFEMDPSDIIKHFGKAAATWHTHPGCDPNLSEADMAGFMQWPNLKHLIAGVRGGEPLTVCFEVQHGALVET